jgi:hypothetical protein
MFCLCLVSISLKKTDSTIAAWVRRVTLMAIETRGVDII